MNKVGVPSTSPEAIPLSTSRRTRSSTTSLARSWSNRATSSPSPVAYRRRSSSSSARCRRNSIASDRPERLPRIRALVVAVLEDQTAGGRAADVVNRLVDRLQRRLVLLPYQVSRHGILRVLLETTARRPCSGIGLGSSRLCVVAALLGGLAACLKEIPCAVMKRLTPVWARSHLPVA